MIAQIDSEQFQMLSLMIEDTTRGMCIYQAATAKEQRLVAEELKRSNRKSTIVIDMAVYAENIEDVPVDIQQFKEILDQKPEAQVVIVCNLQLCGLWMGDSAYIEKLNYMRDQLMECNKMWVFGMTPYFSILLSQQARDLSTYVMFNCSFAEQEDNSVFTYDKMKEYTGDVKLYISRFEEYRRYVLEQTNEGEPDVNMVCKAIQAWLWCSDYLDHTVTAWIKNLTDGYRDAILAVESDQGKLFAYRMFARIYMQFSEYQEALTFFQKRLSLVQEIFPPDSEEVSAAYEDMARGYIEIADFQKAAEYSDKALEIYRRAGKEHSLDTIYLWSYIAELCMIEQNYDRAIEIYQLNIQTVMEASNESDYRLSMSYNILGQTYEKTGRLPEALKCFVKSQELVKRYHSGDAETEITLLNNISAVYQAMGDLNQAKKSLLEAKRRCLHSLGNTNRLMAHIYNNLATVYSDLEQWIPAEQNYKKTIEIEQKIYGKVHTQLAITYKNLAFVYLRQGNPDKLVEAHKLMEEALEICKKLYPPVHGEVAELYANFSFLCYVEGNLDEALDYLETARDMYIKLYGKRSLRLRDFDYNIKLIKKARGY